VPSCAPRRLDAIVPRRDPAPAPALDLNLNLNLGWSWLAGLANMRANGVRSLDVQCHACRHRVIMSVDHLPGDLTVPSFGPKMVCTRAGMISADVRPNCGSGGVRNAPRKRGLALFDSAVRGRITGHAG
jgi:hypothetical protein